MICQTSALATYVLCESVCVWVCMHLCECMNYGFALNLLYACMNSVRLSSRYLSGWEGLWWEWQWKAKAAGKLQTTAVLWERQWQEASGTSRAWTLLFHWRGKWGPHVSGWMAHEGWMIEHLADVFICVIRCTITEIHTHTAHRDTDANTHIGI